MTIPETRAADIRRVAFILESWDMKPPPNDFTGHSYEEIATEILTTLSALNDRAIVGWLRSLDAGDRNWTKCEDALRRYLADAIEAGEYKQETDRG